MSITSLSIFHSIGRNTRKIYEPNGTDNMKQSMKWEKWKRMEINVGSYGGVKKESKKKKFFFVFVSFQSPFLNHWWITYACERWSVWIEWNKNRKLIKQHTNKRLRTCEGETMSKWTALFHLRERVKCGKERIRELLLLFLSFIWFSAFHSVHIPYRSKRKRALLAIHWNGMRFMELYNGKQQSERE